MGNFLNLDALTKPPATNTSTTGSNPRVILPPGVDPYYGITISTLPGVSLGSGEDTSANPLDALFNTGASRSSSSTSTNRYIPKYNERGFQTLDLKALQEAYKNQPDRPSNVPKGAIWDPQSGRWFTVIGDPNTNTSREIYYGDPMWGKGSSTGTGTGNVSGGGMRIAKPNMSWVNNMPSVMPAGGEALLAQYGPAAFSMAANTPQVPTTPRGLTYNNPYNTNPYLPLANPFALIANNPGSTNV